MLKPPPKTPSERIHACLCPQNRTGPIYSKLSMPNQKQNNTNRKRHSLPTHIRHVGQVEGTGLSELEGRDLLGPPGLVSAPAPGGRAAGADVEQVAPDVALGLVRVVVSDAEHAVLLVSLCVGYQPHNRTCCGVVVRPAGAGAAWSVMEEGQPSRARAPWRSPGVTPVYLVFPCNHYDETKKLKPCRPCAAAAARCSRSAHRSKIEWLRTKSRNSYMMMCSNWTNE